jgi:hypothetical protein
MSPLPLDPLSLDTDTADLAAFERAWRSPAHRPTPERLEAERRRFARALERRARSFTLAMAGLGLLLAGMTVVLALSPPAEWALWPLLAPPWVALLLFVRRHRQRERQHPDYDASIADTLRALAAETRAAAARLRTIAVLHAVSLPVLGLSVHQLASAGKLAPHELPSLLATLAALLLTTAGALVLYHHRTLRSRKRQLEALLAEYES